MKRRDLVTMYEVDKRIQYLENLRDSVKDGCKYYSLFREEVMAVLENNSKDVIKKIVISDINSQIDKLNEVLKNNGIE